MPADLQLLPKFRDRLSYLYVEHAVIERDDSSIAIWNQEGKTQAPIAEIALLMLGPGTKLSHAAVDVLARNNCLVAWVGEEGVRLYAFGTGGTHSAGRVLKQARMISDPSLRMQGVRRLYAMRFPEALDQTVTLEQLRGREGLRVRAAYRRLAQQHGIEWSGRSYDRSDWRASDLPNLALTAANACLYGVCHAAILSMGFSPALGFIHTGNQRSFVFDIADLYKLDYAVPAAFEQVAEGSAHLERRVRQALRDKFRDTRFMERVAADILSIFGPDEECEDPEGYDDTEEVGALWDGSATGRNYGDDLGRN